MLFLFRATALKPDDVENAEFYSRWLREADAAIAAREAGLIKWVYKLGGQPTIVAAIEVASPDDMDRLLLALPFWSEGSSSWIHDVSWEPLREYDAWRADLVTLSERKD
jgi:hypothetical protein